MYLDPGTGSMIIAAIANSNCFSCYFYFVLLEQIKEFFKKNKENDKNEKENSDK